MKKILASHDPLPEFEYIKFDHPIKKSVLTIIAKEGNKIMPTGTGFIISPDGLMMTAKHVVEQIYPSYFTSDSSQSSNQFHNRELFALYIESQTTGGLWPIDKVWAEKEGTDIALLFLRPFFHKENGERILHTPFSLSLFPPAINTKIIGAGYYRMTGKFDKVNENILDYEQNSVLTKGKIIEVFPDKRDMIRLPFPCFQTDCKFNGGMSGGPVFRGDTGSVCGVICSSLPSVENESEVSFVSTLWPALATNIDILNNGQQEQIPLLEFAKKGSIRIDEPLENIKIEKEDNGKNKITFTK